jgi:spermidine synthase
MAIIWQETRNGTDYQVRSAGKTIRLYTGNVLHSQYNPTKKLTGSVWDLLFLPVLCLSQTQPLRVLVLGVGGGAIMHMMNDFFKCERIIGLELNPTHIEIAEQFFALNNPIFELIETDAIEWIKHYRGKKFDVIIDDLFFEEKGEPIKVAAPNATWFYHLYSQLKPKGMVVMNFVGRHSAMSASPLHDDNVQKLLPYGLHLTTPFYDNHVLAFSSQPLNSRLIRKTINQHKKLNPLKHSLRFSCRNFSR